MVECQIVSPREAVRKSYACCLLLAVSCLPFTGCAVGSSSPEVSVSSQPAVLGEAANEQAANSDSSGVIGRLGASVLSTVGVTPSKKSFAQDAVLLDAVSTFSREEEYHLGRAVAAHILGKYQLVSDAEVQSYVTKLGRALTAFSDQFETFGGYHFAVLDTDTFNAISAPGGFIFVSRGLVQRLSNEDALSAVLAHEITHVTRQHGIRSISKDRLEGILETAGLLAGVMGCDALLQQATVLFAGAVDEITETLLEKGYSREFEFEADEGASLILVRAGLGSGPIEGVFDALDSDGQGTGGWFSTHPSTEVRRENLTRVRSEQALEGSQSLVYERAPVRDGRFKVVQKLLATRSASAGKGSLTAEHQS